MRRLPLFFLALTLLSFNFLLGEELQIQFLTARSNQTPEGFTSLLTGTGALGDWKIVSHAVPSAFPALTPNAPQVSARPVLAQTNPDPTDERFPLLVYDAESFGDFKLTTRFQLVSGEVERMAGIAFRLQDVNNYYVVRASGLGNTFRFYKVVDGKRSLPIGPSIEIPSQTWHTLGIECSGNRIRCSLNGVEAIPEITDSTFKQGKIAFWTKSDSISYFESLLLTYTPLQSFADTLAKDLLKQFPSLLAVELYAPAAPQSYEFKLAGKAPEDQTSSLESPKIRDAIEDAYQNNHSYFAKNKKKAFLTLPFRDRNGDTVGVAILTLEGFLGQTERNALTQSIPIMNYLHLRIRASQNWHE